MQLAGEVAGDCFEAAVGQATFFVHWKSTSMAAQIHPQLLRDFAEEIRGKLRPNSAP
jgi:hypothetical protein